MLKADDSGVVFQCADCGRKLTYAQTQFRYLPSGCGREPVCRDDRLCELTMDTVVMFQSTRPRGARLSFWEQLIIMLFQT